MQVTTFENPMGIDGFEFVEFAAPQGQGDLLHDYFRRMGTGRRDQRRDYGPVDRVAALVGWRPAGAHLRRIRFFR